MKRAFTLIELLVVVGIMGLLGTASVGGYRAMRIGMEEKGVMGNVNALIRAAYQRAQTDRQPTAVFFWNETVRASTVDENPIVVGKAVAVRRSGRVSLFSGQFLFDEFADLDLTYPTDKQQGGSSANQDNTIYLYPMDDLQQLESSGNILRSTVEGKVYAKTLSLQYLSGMDGKDLDSGNVETFAFKLVDAGGVQWKTGMAYGFEFANIELPHGYIFGQNFSDSSSSPVSEAGTMTFDVGLNTGNGMSSSGTAAGLGGRTSVSVYALRPGTSGALQPKKIGDTQVPTSDIR